MYDAVVVGNVEFYVRVSLRSKEKLVKLAKLLVLCLLVEFSLNADAGLFLMRERHMLGCQLVPVVRSPSTREHQQVKVVACLVAAVCKILCRIGNVAFNLRA